MNEFLAELYGTPENIGGGDDLEKNAAAEFLVKLAAEEGVDLDTLSDDEVGELLAEIEQGEGSGEAEVEDETQEKMAEADFLGRAMAHAYVDELTEIEKEAGVKETGTKAVGWIGKKLEQLGGGAAKRSKTVSGLISGKGEKAYKEQVMKRLQQARGSGMKGRTATRMREAARREGVAAGTKAMGARQKQVGGAILGAGGLATGGLGYGGYKALGGGKEKRQFNENFESLAQERAYEMLAEAGYDVEKVAEADIESMAQERAYEMLAEAGYDVEKVAGADIDTMALQMLEQAGYEVQWNQ